MKLVTYFQSDDGSIHPTESSARQADQLWAAIGDAMSGLGERPALEAGEYRQHDPRDVARARVAIAKILGSTNDGSLVAMVGLTLALKRLDCIDVDGREWGDPADMTDGGANDDQ